MEVNGYMNPLMLAVNYGLAPVYPNL